MVTPLITLGVLPAELTHRFNKTGNVRPLPGIKVTAVAAEHSSLYVWRNPATDKNESHPAGEAVGYIIELENGFKIWHMGDTGLFGDMKFISEYYKPDLVLAPIGGNFTMGPEDTAFAMNTWIKPKMVVPMHYNSNPLATGTLAQFQEAMKGSAVKVVPMSEGQMLEF
jgi:L-ascorbate metabolism protein UlaG (beta-lactamase superfamily)